jgi:hypothetical protein
MQERHSIAAMALSRMANAHRPTLPPGTGSTLGAAAFHDLVRDGSAWDHRAPDTRLPLALDPTSPGLHGVVSSVLVQLPSWVSRVVHALTRGDRQALGGPTESALPLAGPALLAGTPGHLPGTSRAEAPRALILRRVSHLDAFSGSHFQT